MSALQMAFQRAGVGHEETARFLCERFLLGRNRHSTSKLRGARRQPRCEAACSVDPFERNVSEVTRLAAGRRTAEDHF
jgi:hypothetical protein